MIPPAAAPIRPPVTAPRWVFGPVGSAQFVREKAQKPETTIRCIFFMVLVGFLTFRPMQTEFKEFFGLVHRNAFDEPGMDLFGEFLAIGGVHVAADIDQGAEIGMDAFECGIFGENLVGQ